ncbi:hypothetical protein O181_019225 [Austropuccinia psidii MF-1]|uniref:Uncharacterized protein n=1 Tax=Austropuccinia psidii MF-1 TaxID=1389203 RepID=A0A9Q3CA70_9BASI|nr:hypothetical protein [Austropuccinia psidii MF-1]
MPCKQAPGPSGTQWSEDWFCEPSQHNEPPIPGPIQTSEPHEDALTREPEPEVAPTKSMEEHFACPSTPASFPPVPSFPHSYNEAWQEFTDLQSNLMIP